jgi:hypothetical protein
MTIGFSVVNPLLSFWTKSTDIETIRREEVQMVYFGLEETINKLKAKVSPEELIVSLTQNNDECLSGLAQLPVEQYARFKARYDFCLPPEIVKRAATNDRLKGAPLVHLVLDYLYRTNHSMTEVLKNKGSILMQQTYREGVIVGENNIYRSDHNLIVDCFKR